MPGEHDHLTAEQARELLAQYEDDDRLSREHAGVIPFITSALNALPEEERGAWVRRHRPAMYRALLGAPRGSRSSMYQQAAAMNVLGRLREAGRIDDDDRDVQSGRKMRSIVYELARLNLTDDGLLASYDNVRTMSLVEVKTSCATSTPAAGTDRVGKPAPPPPGARGTPVAPAHRRGAVRRAAWSWCAPGWPRRRPPSSRHPPAAGTTAWG